MPVLPPHLRQLKIMSRIHLCWYWYHLLKLSSFIYLDLRPNFVCIYSFLISTQKHAINIHIPSNQILIRNTLIMCHSIASLTIVNNTLEMTLQNHSLSFDPDGHLTCGCSILRVLEQSTVIIKMQRETMFQKKNLWKSDRTTLLSQLVINIQMHTHTRILCWSCHRSLIL